MAQEAQHATRVGEVPGLGERDGDEGGVPRPRVGPGPVGTGGDRPVRKGERVEVAERLGGDAGARTGLRHRPVGEPDPLRHRLHQPAAERRRSQYRPRPPARVVAQDREGVVTHELRDQAAPGRDDGSHRAHHDPTHAHLPRSRGDLPIDRAPSVARARAARPGIGATDP